ncbi:MAG: hypothetical protein K6F86_10725 [Lachnospiraceae bacterium]|nr:hypothetical protein [Lachnospiraceae bacterium]
MRAVRAETISILCPVIRNETGAGSGALYYPKQFFLLPAQVLNYDSTEVPMPPEVIHLPPKPKFFQANYDSTEVPMPPEVMHLPPKPKFFQPNYDLIEVPMPPEVMHLPSKPKFFQPNYDLFET